LLNSSFQKGLDIRVYYTNLFKIIKKAIADLNIYVFDVEYDGYNLNEFAFLQNGNIVSATNQNSIQEKLSNFEYAISNSNSFIAGHNIEKFDIPIVKEKIAIPEHTGVIDTLFLEILLSPNLKSFALKTKHNAKDDVEHTLNLLTNQVVRLIHMPEIK